MNRIDELKFMIKGAEVNLLYACKTVCEKGVNSETKVNLDYAVQIYNFIHNSLAEYAVDEPENLTEEVESNVE